MHVVDVSKALLHLRTPQGKTVKEVNLSDPEVIRRMQRKRPGVRVIDLFCGAGGFSEGFHQSGFDVVYGIDFWPPACETHAINGLGVTDRTDLLKAGVDVDRLDRGAERPRQDDRVLRRRNGRLGTVGRYEDAVDLVADFTDLAELDVLGCSLDADLHAFHLPSSVRTVRCTPA